jgi:hypothetical protein
MRLHAQVSHTSVVSIDRVSRQLPAIPEQNVNRFLLEHDPEKACPHLMRGGYRFSEKIMLKQRAKA